MKILLLKKNIIPQDTRPLWKERGMTLIELTIVVVITAVLAAIAYPSYQQYVVRANRSEVQQLMLDIANREEEYFLNNRSYGNKTELAINVPQRIEKFYSVYVDPPTAQTYMITATPKAEPLKQMMGLLPSTSRV